MITNMINAFPPFVNHGAPFFLQNFRVFPSKKTEISPPFSCWLRKVHKNFFLFLVTILIFRVLQHFCHFHLTVATQG